MSSRSNESKRFARAFSLIEARSGVNEGAYVSMWLNERVSVTKSKGKDRSKKGVVAQLGEHLPCTQGVRSSILLGSTKKLLRFSQIKALLLESVLIWSNQTFIKKMVNNEVKTQATCIVRMIWGNWDYMVKKRSANGGCLGSKRRWRTWNSAKSFGELKTSD